MNDINDFHIMAMNDDRTNRGVYNLGTGKNVSILEIFETIAKVLGTDIKPEFKPSMEGEAQENLADITKSLALGWAPKTNLEDGMRGMVEYIKRNVLNK